MAERTPLSADALLAHSGWVWHLARCLAADAEQAEDLVQDTYLAALRSGPSDPRRLRGWLAVVLRNFARRARRGDARSRAREHEVARSEREPSTGELCERAEAHRLVVREVLALDEPYRSAVLMRFLDELPPRRIAAELGVPVRTVNTRIARGLARLRERLDAERQGDARAWLLAVLPAGHTPPPAPALPWGLLVMNTKLKLALSAIVLVALSAGLLRVLPNGSAVVPAAAARPGVSAAPTTAAAFDASGDETAPERVSVEERGSAARVLSQSLALSALSGRVVDPNGAPVGGAEVVARLRPAATFELLQDPEFHGQVEEAATTSTAADGTFELGLRRNQPHQLEVTADGYASNVLDLCYGGQFVLVRMQRGASVYGFVTRLEDDSPVAGAHVRITHGHGVLRTDAWTGAQGAFRADDLMAGPAGLAVTPLEDALGRYRTFELVAGQRVRHDVEVASGVTARGRVTDRSSGLPIAGAEVSSWNFHGKTVRTDEAGFFRIAGVEASVPVVIAARAPGYGRLERAFVPEADIEYDLALIPALRATGRILESDGSPIAGAYVAACARESEDEVPRFDWRATSSTPDGSFDLRDLRGDVPYTLFVRKTSFGSVTRLFPDKSGGRFEFGDIVLGDSASLSGRVVDSAGAGVAAWVNVLGPQADDTGKGADWSLTRRLVRADGEGRFRCADLASGRYELQVSTASRPNAEDFVVELAGGEQLDDLELLLPSGLKVEGRVVDPHGAPVAKVEVGLAREGEGKRSVSRARTASDGSFRIAGLEPGTYTLSARLWGPWPGGEEGVELAPFRRAGVEPGGAPIEIELAAQRTVVNGTVRDGSGAAISRAFVFVHRGLEEPAKGVLTDDGGRFALPVAELGALELRARRTLHLGEWTDDFTRLDVLVGRKVLGAERGEARARVQAPSATDVLLVFEK